MDNAKRSRRPGPRRLIQLYSALLYNAHLRGFITGEIYRGKAKYACVPGLNCYSCPGAIASCPLGALQNALSASGHRAGWYALGILLLFGVTLGRTVCGWLCPFGLIQELLHRIPTYKIRKNPVTQALSGLKYVILAVFALTIPLWYGLRLGLPLPAFCKYLCPAGTLEGAGGLLANPANASLYDLLGLLFTRKLIILAVVCLSCVFLYRAFCRFLCPLGAIYGLFNRFSVVGVRVDQDRCTVCGECVRSCPMDVRMVGDRECIQCGKCIDACGKSAISIRAGRITLKAPEIKENAPSAPEAEGNAPAAPRFGRAARLLQGAALALLCFALLWFNLLDPSLKKADASASVSDAPVGSAVGQRLADFSLVCLDGSEFRLADTRGKVVFINLWATYCAPCVRELEYFDDLARQHGEDVALLAVHSALVIDDPAEYLEGRDYSFPFAVDTEDGALWQTVGGGATLPQTIVLNRRGEVVYNQVNSVTPESLTALYAQADQGGE